MASIKTETFPVSGMHCASCANIIKRTLTKVKGVEKVDSYYGTEEAVISYDPTKTDASDFNEVLSPLGYSVKVEAVGDSGTAKTADHGGGHNHAEELDDAQMQVEQQQVQFALPLALLMFVAMLWEIASQRFVNVPMMPIPESLWLMVQFLLASLVIITSGQVFVKAVGLFIKYRKANMDTLVGIGTLTAFIYSTFGFFFPSILSNYGLPQTLYFDVVIVVIGFVKYGKYLEAQSKTKTGEALKALLHLQAKTAEVQQDTGFKVVPIESVMAGDVVRVKPGASIAVDGVVIEGESLVNESMITGESLPVKKKVGDQVIGSTLNENSVLLIKAEKVGSETVLSRIIQLVKNAQNSKAPVERIADQVSAIFVPVVLVIAVLTLVIWIALGSSWLPLTQATAFGLSCMIGVLVIACPCALGLATPTAIIVGVGQAAKRGILIKNAESLEQLQAVTRIVFDKTGTLTTGQPAVQRVVVAKGVTHDRAISIAMNLESQSDHPLAKAIVAYAESKGLTANSKVDKFQNLAGEGVKGRLEGKEYSLLSLAAAQIKAEAFSAFFQPKVGESVVMLLSGNKVLAAIAVADHLKPSSIKAIESLKKMKIKVMVLSGDRQETVRSIADQVGIEEAIGELKPEQKLEKIRELQAAGEVVAMVGDGINDAPALAAANVGIALSTGTDVAMSTAHATILKGDLQKVVTALGLSRSVMRTIKQNLFWAFGYNVVGIPLAAGVFFPVTGWLLSPAFAGFAMAFSSVSVVLNSLRLRWQKTEGSGV